MGHPKLILVPLSRVTVLAQLRTLKLALIMRPSPLTRFPLKNPLKKDSLLGYPLTMLVTTHPTTLRVTLTTLGSLVKVILGLMR